MLLVGAGYAAVHADAYSYSHANLVEVLTISYLHMKTGIKCIRLGSFRRYLIEVSISGARRKFEGCLAGWIRTIWGALDLEISILYPTLI
eukprot:SAG31_NODE_2441_length_5684_cov_6.528021_3_plen_90_part_00